MADDEGGIEIPLSNKQGAILLVLLAALFAWNYYRVRQEAPDAVIEPVKSALAAEYAGQALPSLEASMAANDRAQSEKQARALLENMKNIEVRSVSVRGTGDEIYVRAEVRVNGGEPPDGRRVRYFEFSRSALLGWVYAGPATAFDYYTTFF